MTMLWSGVVWNVNGMSIPMAPTGPSPGRTPTSVPISVPAKQNNRLYGSPSMDLKPKRRPSKIPIYSPQKIKKTFGQLASQFYKGVPGQQRYHNGRNHRPVYFDPVQKQQKPCQYKGAEQIPSHRH